MLLFPVHKHNTKTKFAYLRELVTLLHLMTINVSLLSLPSTQFYVLCHVFVTECRKLEVEAKVIFCGVAFLLGLMQMSQ
jgi:hypothetical protein